MWESLRFSILFIFITETLKLLKEYLKEKLVTLLPLLKSVIGSTSIHHHQHPAQGKKESLIWSFIFAYFLYWSIHYFFIDTSKHLVFFSCLFSLNGRKKRKYETIYMHVGRGRDGTDHQHSIRSDTGSASRKRKVNLEWTSQKYDTDDTLKIYIFLHCMEEPPDLLR